MENIVEMVGMTASSDLSCISKTSVLILVHTGTVLHVHYIPRLHVEYMCIAH